MSDTEFIAYYVGKLVLAWCTGYTAGLVQMWTQKLLKASID